ncbi:Transcription factor SFL2 [Candida viswanathii]|uniref:Transcription factor SFL2 n=1 Tax=Candida viswanathii TaxID=5486 RepID=A0A367YGE3_9ASCO|nr:Transcription factor SFL2 [Candida viswanathii]RCK66572.1 Transcription factor SFL2 [Candida viswanathii]
MSKKNNPGDPRIKKNAFVHKLYTMLNDPNLSHLIWWTTNNVEENTFALYPGKEFANCLTQYFKHGNVASFVRQLHMYGFHKVSDPNAASSSSSYAMNPINKDVPPIWEFKHLSGKFKKGDEKSLAFIKRRSSSNSSGSRNNSYNETLQNHQPISQEYPMVQQTTYDPYNLNITFQPPPPPPQQQHFLYYNQPQPAVPPPLPQPPPPPLQQQQQLPTPYQQKMATPQFVYGQPFFQYPGPPSTTMSPQPTETGIQPPVAVSAPGSAGSHFADFSQFLLPMTLQQPQNAAPSAPRIQQPTPQYIEQQQAPPPPPPQQLPHLQQTTIDQAKIDPLTKSPRHNSSSGYSATLQFRKIWDANSTSTSRQRNPSLLFDPLSTIPPTNVPVQPQTSPPLPPPPTSSSSQVHIGLQRESVTSNGHPPALSRGESMESATTTHLPPPSHINRSTSLNAVPISPGASITTPPEAFRRSTTPLLPSLSHPYSGPPRLATSIPRNSSPLVLSTTSESSPTPTIVAGSTTPGQPPQPQPQTPSASAAGVPTTNAPKKPSLFSSSLQERLRPSVFEIHQGNKSPPINQRTATTTTTTTSASGSAVEITNSKQNSITSHNSSIFSNKSSISSIGSVNYRPPSIGCMTRNSITVSTQEETTHSSTASRTWTPVNGNNSNGGSGGSGSGNLSPRPMTPGQRSMTGSPITRVDSRSKKVSVTSLLEDEQKNLSQEEDNLGAKHEHAEMRRINNEPLYKSSIITEEEKKSRSNSQEEDIPK